MTNFVIRNSIYGNNPFHGRNPLELVVEVGSVPLLTRHGLPCDDEILGGSALGGDLRELRIFSGSMTHTSPTTFPKN